MFRIESWQEIFETMGKNKLQTALTMISVFFGIFILVILVGFSSGIEKGVKSQFEEDATNKISIRTGRTTKEFKGLNPGRIIQLRNKDYEEFNEKYKENIEYKTSVFSTWGGQVVYKGEIGNYRIEGAYPDQQFIENQGMVSGRFINNNDINEIKKVAIIGNQIKEDLFKKNNPIGAYIEIL
jgi:putative ABC transport system permease protein